jgi:Zn ribbon nucleic-acid-binding protein
VGRFAQIFHRKLRDGPNFAPFVGLHEVRPSGVGGGAAEKRSFVVKEQTFIRPLRCVKCGGNAHLTRRSPDPVKKDGSEIRIFECHECGHQTERIANG